MNQKEKIKRKNKIIKKSYLIQLITTVKKIVKEVAGALNIKYFNNKLIKIILIHQIKKKMVKIASQRDLISKMLQNRKKYKKLLNFPKKLRKKLIFQHHQIKKLKLLKILGCKELYHFFTLNILMSYWKKKIQFTVLIKNKEQRLKKIRF